MLDPDTSSFFFRFNQYPRHRKSKLRPDQQPEPTPSAHIDAKQSEQLSATSATKPSPQDPHALASVQPTSTPMLTNPETSVHVALVPHVSEPTAASPSVSQLTSDMHNVSLSSSSTAHSHHQQQQSNRTEQQQQLNTQSHAELQTLQQQQLQTQPQPSSHPQFQHRNIQQSNVSRTGEGAQARQSPDRNASLRSPVSSSCQVPHAMPTPRPEQHNLAHKSPGHHLPQHVLPHPTHDSQQQHQLPVQMQMHNHMVMQPMPLSQPVMHSQPQLVLQPQYCPPVSEAVMGSDTNSVNVNARPMHNQRQLLQHAMPLSADQPSSATDSQSYVFTRAVNVSSATVPYQLVSPAASVQCNAYVPASGVTPQVQAGKQNDEDNMAAATSASSGPAGPTQAPGQVSDKKDIPIKEAGEAGESDKIAQFVSRVKSSVDGQRARPLICQDINNSHADTLRISRLPRGVTYDRLHSMVEPFGEVEELAWSSTDPYVCEVTYCDPAAAHEAKHFLGDAMVGNDSEPPLKAELYSRQSGAQLFVGDLTPDVTEEMLETTFSQLVGEPVTALLKRDPDSFSPIGYGFLSFRSESSANFALVAGHRVRIGNACVRVGRAERNTYLYVSDLSPNVSMSELKDMFSTFGSLVEEDTVIIRRSYAFVRYKNRSAAEKAKRTLDKTDLKGRLSVRYAEAEPLKACVAVQFHSSVPRPPNSLRDLLTATFSKHGNCSVEIPRLTNGMWRKVAFVTFHGDPMAANLAALEAVQSIRFVSSLPVCCQFARELIPRLPSKGLAVERLSEANVAKSNLTAPSERVTAKLYQTKKNNLRRTEQQASASKGNVNASRGNPQNIGNEFRNEKHGRGPNLVPIYVPITALQHPNAQIPPGSIIGPEGATAPFQWQGRVLVPGESSGDVVGNSTQNVNSTYTPLGRMPEPRSKW
eukprot:TRINITY_DN853_c0_g1_i1.p1 TRINITY_DN853_c0_g1~~TRINITY_DN853_c0_g1_i1.p1  ORF type:complete len:925 (+),score=147.07 TRINITY_DN853_c0_g1_i1:6813-9587(+)